MIRIRSRNEPLYQWPGGTTYWWATPPYTLSSRILAPFSPKREMMRDETHTRRAVGGMPVYKPVTHTLYEVSNFVDPLPSVAWGTNPTISVTGMTGSTHLIEALNPTDPNYHLRDLLSELVSASTDVLGSISPFRTHFERWQATRPTLTSRANLFVFFAELRDIKRMFDIIPPRHFSLNSWRDVLNYTNKQHLNYNFGWKPFVRDIKSVFKGLSSFDDRLARFIDQQSRVLRSNVRDTVIDGSLEVKYEPVGCSWYAKQLLSYSITNSSSFTYSYSVPYSDSNLRWSGLLDTLGLGVTPANVWAIIPWSFVVDWFIPVGSMLSVAETDWSQPWVNFSQACATQKVISNAKWYVRCANAGGNTGNPYVRVLDLRIRRFVRSLGIPGWSANVAEFDTDKIRLLSSLLLGLHRW